MRIRRWALAMNAWARERWPRLHAKARDVVRPARHALARWRRRHAAREVIARTGYRVAHGPFAGLRYSRETLDTRFVSKLLGLYEHPLEDVVERIAVGNYPLIVNIGCAEGYYAVGLARRLRDARVVAIDTDERQRALCRRLADDNGVRDRVDVRPQLSGSEALESLIAGARTVVLSDCENAEFALLRPDLAPSLAVADLLVELHPDQRDTSRRSSRDSPIHTSSR